MKKMKKVISILMCGIMVMALGGCGSSDSGSKEAASTSTPDASAETTESAKAPAEGD